MGMQNFPGVDKFSRSIGVRRGSVRDVNYIKDIDMKSYQYPWPYEHWITLGEDETYHWCVAAKGVEPVGFAVWQDHPHAVEIHRLAVKPADQGEGTGTSLMDYVCGYAKDCFFNRVVVVVPEINCLPGDPDDVSGWLAMQGFKAEPPILKDHVCRYGTLIDCYTFVRALL
jgi:GNAT superfamily N-acetyltransferase